ncbi:hypothetical protein [Xenorhabdus littoralis]|uniref:hypothetical protein n=1 Tax=Xenorhabdus littoralis TaxID=2582835 RepID=UPI0029E7CEF1|nr:hypothetical protein [Xenorhabdus sp. psl]MDX7992755.1 hypothetical protein [Xenorhabdus sp. psl]
MNKIFLCFSAVMLTAFPHISFAAYTSNFETKTYDIIIDVRCSEGNISCDDVIFTVVNKKNHNSLMVKGRTLNRDCKTGSCDFYGYEFKDKKITYIIYQYGDLELSEKGNVIFSEDGNFKY